MQIPQLWSHAMRRVLLALVLLSAGLGFFEYWLEIERVEDQVVHLAGEEAHGFVNHFINQDAMYEDLEALENDARRALLDHFPIVEFYDSDRQKRLEVMVPGSEWVEEKLRGKKHGFPEDGKPIYHRIDVEDEVFIQVLIPLENGFFEGVYRLDERTLNQVHDATMRAAMIVMLSVIITGLVLLPLLLGLNRELIKTSKSILAGNIELMEVLGSAIAKRDSDTSTHNYRVTLYAIELAKCIALPDEKMRSLIAGAFLHDVGKIGISDAILLKPGRLTSEEFSIMKQHVELGGQILEKSSWLGEARDVVLNHHEKYNGSGYPKGSSGEEIPLTARIFAVVDVFDALTSKRPYKEPMSLEKSLGIIESDAGSHFDPNLVRVFKQIAPELYQRLSTLPDQAVEQLLREQANEFFGLSA